MMNHITKNMKVNIEPHNSINKRFDVDTDHLSLKVDFDDVNHAEVDAAIQQVKKIIEENWDYELHQKLYKEEVMKIWNANEYGLQSDYDDEGGLKGYLEEREIYIM